MLNKIKSYLWNLWCLVSLIGIWPRFIEPRLIDCREIPLSFPPELAGLRLLQFSDLHFHKGISDRFLQKVIKKARAAKPDLIVFTGDFLCYSQLDEREKLKEFLQEFSAPCGCYAILGNHDYSQSVSVSETGDYDIISPPSSYISKGFSRLFHRTVLTKQVTPAARQVEPHKELIQLLADTPFQLLHNETIQIKWNLSKLNLTGLGEYMAGQMDPKKAFAHFDSDYPGITLAHNPDSAPLLQTYPGTLILSGHTHGGQINLPWLWKKFTLLENRQFKRGLCPYGQKHVYVNKGIGSLLPFRWFARPELTIIEAKQ